MCGCIWRLEINVTHLSQLLSTLFSSQGLLLNEELTEWLHGPIWLCLPRIEVISVHGHAWFGEAEDSNLCFMLLHGAL